MRLLLLLACVLTLVPVQVGAGVIDLGKFTPIVKTDSDEHFYLVKEAYLTSGSPAAARTSFDHTMYEVVKLCFVPKDEKNVYVAESRWLDPMGIEYRTIRHSYDRQEEGKQGIERPKGGTTRILAMPTAELFAHKPGMWKVELYLDGKLARRLTFSIQ
jgi:hypothetical protein